MRNFRVWVGLRRPPGQRPILVPDHVLNDERQAQIFRKMAATVDTIPYDMLAELGHNYNPVLISAHLLLHLHADASDYADAYDLVLTLLDELRSIDLDHPDTQKALEQLGIIFKFTGPPNPQAQSDR
jgi:hypothetical protein